MNPSPEASAKKLVPLGTAPCCAPAPSGSDACCEPAPSGSEACCEPAPSGGEACCAAPGPGPNDVRDAVREGYARIATQGGWSADVAPAGGSCCAPAAGSATAPASAAGGCCGPATFSAEQLAQAIGYSQAELASAPKEANLGLSCGNPTALASLKPGEIVLDLGAGGGFDCFVAGPKVGATGRVIGVDMTPEMISRARTNVATYRSTTGLDNVEFRLGEIEHLPVPDGSVDVVISNCVLNLSPDKPQVWREIARVLKPGGRVAVSDLALLRPIPDTVLRDVEALVGCVAGAALVGDVRRMAEDAGLRDLALEPKAGYVEAMTNWEDPLYQRIAEALPAGARISDYVTSLEITATR